MKLLAKFKFYALVLYTLVLCTLLISPSYTLSADVLGNRLILSINNSAYTQRELEIYVLVHGVLSENIQEFRLKKEDWLPALTKFKNDMLAATEAERLRQSRLDPQEQTKLLEQLKIAIQRRGIQAATILLGINDTDLLTALTLYTQARNYEKSQNQLSHPVSILEKNYFIHFFKEAEVFKPITPNL